MERVCLLAGFASRRFLNFIGLPSRGDRLSPRLVEGSVAPCGVLELQGPAELGAGEIRTGEVDAEEVDCFEICALEAGSDEFPELEDRPNTNGAVELRLSAVRLGKVGVGEAGVCEVRFDTDGADELGPVEASVLEPRLGHVRPDKAGAAKPRFGEVCLMTDRPAKVRFRAEGAMEVRLGAVGVNELRLGYDGSREVRSRERRPTEVGAIEVQTGKVRRLVRMRQPPLLNGSLAANLENPCPQIAFCHRSLPPP